MADRSRVFGAVAVAILAAMLPGCLSPVPLDPKPQADLDPRIVGRWRCVAPVMDDDDLPMSLSIARARERVYSVEMFDNRFEAYASVVDGRTIVNVRDSGPGPGAEPWDFAEYEFLRPDVLALRLADFQWPEDVAMTPTALRERIARSDAFKDFCVCVRLKEQD